MLKLDHVTIRTAELDSTRDFFRDVLDLTVGYRPAFGFPGYWLYAGEEPIVHLIPGTGGAVDRRGETIDHIGFRIADYNAQRQRLDTLGLRYSTQAFPELRERRLFVTTLTGVLIELVAREG